MNHEKQTSPHSEGTAPSLDDKVLAGVRNWSRIQAAKPVEQRERKDRPRLSRKQVRTAAGSLLVAAVGVGIVGYGIAHRNDRLNAELDAAKELTTMHEFDTVSVRDTGKHPSQYEDAERRTILDVTAVLDADEMAAHGTNAQRKLNEYSAKKWKSAEKVHLGASHVEGHINIPGEDMDGPTNLPTLPDTESAIDGRIVDGGDEGTLQTEFYPRTDYAPGTTATLSVVTKALSSHRGKRYYHEGSVPFVALKFDGEEWHQIDRELPPPTTIPPKTGSLGDPYPAGY